MSTHYRRPHSRQGRPVRGTTAHHRAGRVPSPREPSEPRQWSPLAVAGQAVVLGLTLTITYAVAAVLSLTAALLCGVTTWALAEVGIYQRRRRRRRPRLVLSRRRRRQLRLYQLRRRLDRWAWRKVRPEQSEGRERMREAG